MYRVFLVLALWSVAPAWAAEEEHGAKAVDPLEIKRIERHKKAREESEKLSKQLDDLVAKASAVGSHGSLGDKFNTLVGVFYQTHEAIIDHCEKWDKKEDSLSVIEQQVKTLQGNYEAVSAAFDKLHKPKK